MAGATKTFAARVETMAVFLVEPVEHDGVRIEPGATLVCAKPAAEALLANGAALAEQPRIQEEVPPGEGAAAPTTAPAAEPAAEPVQGSLPT